MIRSAIAESPGLLGLDTLQAIFVGLGMIVILITSLIDYRYWASLSRVMYIGIIAFLFVIFVVGTTLYGSARWLDTGLVFVQPSELAKIIMILVLADFFARNKDTKRNLRWIGNSFALTMGVAIWILLQPNLSTSIVILVVWFSYLWISGLPIKYLLSFSAIGMIAFIFIILLLASGVDVPLLHDYQVGRVINFAFPDPTARHGDSYNVEQALITIGSGGLFGQGYGQSSQVQLRFLKVRHTDFIFSALAGEFGFVGTMLVVVMIIFIILRCLRAARKASDLYGSLIAYGFAILLFFQSAVNIGVNLNVIPVAGLPLPFISYGGSSLLSLVLGVGLVESVIARHKSWEF
ncbi:MAG: FtsW/RodA/SpoVE family cell cycle protein, partial [Anaerolineaceae bacterium]